MEILKVLLVIVWIECSSGAEQMDEIPIGHGMEVFAISIRKTAIIQVQSSVSKDLSANESIHFILCLTCEGCSINDISD